MDAINGLNHWLDQITLLLEPSQRRELMRRLGQGLRVRHRDRIKSQKDVDNHNFIPRKDAVSQISNPPLRFLYKKAGGKTREAIIKSYQNTGASYTGFDQKANGIRTFRKSRIVKYLPTNGISSSGGSSIRSQVGKIKQKAMFQHIGKRLKTEYSENHVSIGFGGRTGFVASVHQEGKSIRPSKNAKSTRYPVRELVGFSKDDQEWVKSEIKKFLTL